MLGSAAFDRSRSRSPDGTGSFRLVTPFRPGSAASSRVFSDYIPVEHGGLHTYGFYLLTTSGPSSVWAQIGIYDRDRKFLRNLNSTSWGTAADGRWEECALTVMVPTDAAFVRLKALKGESPRGRNRVWVDDFYFGAGFSLEQPTSPKVAFESEQVRVDALGNFEVKRDGNFAPFFPLGIYADSDRDWQVYSRQGWNVVMRIDSADQAQQARDAVSDFNPRGMLAGFSITPYTMPASPLYHDLKALGARLRETLDRGLGDQLLFYHWDNERHHDQWRVPWDVVRSLRRIDVDSSGRRQRPVYALQGTAGLARMHAGRGLVDVSGTYVGGSTLAPGGLGDRGGDRLLILDRIEYQTSPASFAQFNRVRGAGDMRLRLYNSIILGARGMGYWRDCPEADCLEDAPEVGPVDGAVWWPDIPRLRREVDALLPIIRQPHWTSWTATVASPDRVSVGTRERNGVGYLILANQTSVQQEVSVTLDGLAYRVESLVDYFSGERIGTIRDAAISLALQPTGVGTGTRVLRLVPRAEGAENPGLAGEGVN